MRSTQAVLTVLAWLAATPGLAWGEAPSSVAVDQIAAPTANSLVVVRDPRSGEVFASQVGDADMAFVALHGGANAVRLVQGGAGDRADVAAGGVGQMATVVQQGAVETAAVVQSGRFNVATVRQGAPGAWAFVGQAGAGNVATVLQGGVGRP